MPDLSQADSLQSDLRWSDALTAAALLAVDPIGLGGALLRARAGPQRARWLARLQASLPAAMPLRRVPLHIADERLLGGLDLSATLQAGRPVAQRGLLAEADGGLVLLAMAERVTGATAARLAAVLDQGEVLMERDGLTLRQPARIGRCRRIGRRRVMSDEPATRPAGRPDPDGHDRDREGQHRDQGQGRPLADRCGQLRRPRRLWVL